MTGIKRLALGAAVWGLLAAPASADVESWSWIETRIPLSNGQHGLPHSLRTWTDARFGGRYTGMGALFLRVGPIWELHPNLFLAVHGTSYGLQPSPGVFEQEYRAEVEPNLRGRWGDWVLGDRNRMELRWRPSGASAGPRWRYRNLLRVNYQPLEARWIPFVWNEALIDLSGSLYSENRAAAGVGYQFNNGVRVDLAYLLRSRLTAGSWEQDHVANLALFFAPGVAPLFPAEPSPD
jgi:hypothetical protein